jgi:hypothetical protein
MPQCKQPVLRTHALAIGSKIYVYTDAGGASLATLYTNSGKGTPKANPVTVGADGCVNFFCDTWPLYYRTRSDFEHVRPFTMVEGGEDITGLTASVAELNKLTGSGTLVPSGTAAAHIVAAKVDYADDGTANDLDTDARRVAAMNAANAKINSILVALETFGITASS